MAKIRFSNGQVVNFDGDPTEQDIEEVAAILGIQQKTVDTSLPQRPSVQGETGIKGVGVGARKFAAKEVLGAGQLGEKLFRGAQFLGAKAADLVTGGDTKVFGTPTGAENLKAIAPQGALTPQTQAEKIGFYGTEIASYLIPGTSALKAERAFLGSSKIASMAARPLTRTASRLQRTAGLGVRAGTEATAVGGLSTINEGEINSKSITDATVAALFPVLGTQISPFVKKGIPKLMRFMSPIDDAAFDILVQRAATISKKIKAKVIPKETRNFAQKTTRNLKDKLSKEWSDGVSALKEEFKNQSVDLPKPIVNGLKDLDEVYKLFKIPRNLKNIKVNRALELNTQLNELWMSKSVRESAEGATVRKFKKEYRNFLINSFGGGKGTAVDNLLRSYSNKADIFAAADDILSAYSKGKPVKNASVLGRLNMIFKEGKVDYLDAVMDLEKEMGVDILSDLAAQKFSTVFPSVSKSEPMKALKDYLLFAFTSPRVSKNITTASQKSLPSTGITPIENLRSRIFGK